MGLIIFGIDPLNLRVLSVSFKLNLRVVSVSFKLNVLEIYFSPVTVKTSKSKVLKVRSTSKRSRYSMNVLEILWRSGL